VLDAVKRGKQVFYTVRYAHVVRLLRQLADALEACCVPQAGASARGDDTERPT
jgi:predicted dinucleotide-binding enzyme